MHARLLKTTKPQPVPSAAEQVTLRTRDGVRLATDVYLPPRPTKHPAILVRTPYDKDSRYTGLFAQARFYNERGYVFVTQDVRGKFRSEGQTLPYHFDMADGYDTIDWIVSQPWSDGTVGLTGASYYGYTVWAALASGHPAVRAAVPRVTGADKAADHLGALWTHRVPRLTGFHDLVQIWTDNDDYLIETDYTAAHVLDLLADMESLVGKSAAVAELLARARSREHFNPFGARHPYYTTDIPILHWVNWYDPGLAPFGMTDWRHFRSNPSRRHLHYLRAGSADHGEYLLSDVGRGDERNPYLNDATQQEMLAHECGEAIDFFDEHVRGLRPGRPRERARWHLGHAGWNHSTEWPPLDQATQCLFLTPESGGMNHKLTKTADTSVRAIKWIHDPDNPVPSSTSVEAIWYFLAAYPDERGLARRDDVLTFTSEPLSRPVDIAGQAVLRTLFTTTAPTMHLFATLQDVESDGTTRPVAHGHMVAAPSDEEMLMLPLDDVAYRFRNGHSIQLQIRCSNFPWYLVHPGTDENPWFARRRVKAEQTLLTGGIAPARLDLPLYRS